MRLETFVMLAKNASPRSREEHEEDTKFSFDDLSRQVVDACFKVHQTIGVGLLEGIYEECLALEFSKREIPFKRQVDVPVFYEGVKIPVAYRLDMVIDGKIILELKSVERVLPAHEAQILSYMKTSGIETGLLVNFGEAYFKRAIKRFVTAS